MRYYAGWNKALYGRLFHAVKWQNKEAVRTVCGRRVNRGNTPGDGVELADCPEKCPRCKKLIDAGGWGLAQPEPDYAGVLAEIGVQG